MPIYEYECAKGHRQELILSIKEMENLPTIICGREVVISEEDAEGYTCMLKAEKVWSQLGLVSGISQTTPTVIFRNANNPNDIRPAIYKGQETPNGYIKEELKTPMERSRVEREMAKIQDAQDDFDTAKREFVTNHTRKERHSDLKARMNAITKDAENPFQAEHLLKKAMERSNKKKVPRKKSQMHFAVNHTDSSNMVKG